MVLTRLPLTVTGRRGVAGACARAASSSPQLQNVMPAAPARLRKPLRVVMAKILPVCLVGGEVIRRPAGPIGALRSNRHAPRKRGIRYAPANAVVYWAVRLRGR